MNQKEYELIVSILDELSCELMDAGIYEKLARAFASKLQATYTSFDRIKFLERCGIQNG